MKRWILMAALAVGSYSVPSMAHAQQAVITIAPPLPQAEVIPPQPSPNHAWIHGHWRWDGGRYNWDGGRWEVPPQPGHVYIAPHYEPSGNGWGYVGGRWAAPAPVAVAPPIPVPEVQPAAPGPNYRWAGGHYEWNGERHFWNQGRWIAPPAGRVYVEPRWEQRGHDWHYHAHEWH